MLTLAHMGNVTEMQRVAEVDPRAAALARAVALVGGPAALARRLSISSQAVSQWRRVPAERVLDVERATADPETLEPRVSRHELRPDIYPTERADGRHAASAG